MIYGCNFSTNLKRKENKKKIEANTTDMGSKPCSALTYKTS